MIGLGHKQAGREAVAGLTAQEKRLEEVLLSCILVLFHFRPWRN